MATSQLTLAGAALSFLFTLAGCGGGAAQDPPPRANVQAAVVQAAVAPAGTVTGMTKISETRISRTVFDYVFRISVRNDSGTSLTAVTATLTEVGEGASIIDGVSVVGAMSAGATVTPVDTITIRQDRVQPFNQAALVWAVSGTPPPSVGGLPGNPADNANRSITDVDTGEVYADAEYSVDPADNNILRTLVAIAIKQSATVGQVNALLSRISGRIVFASAGTGIIYVRIPDPLTISNLYAVISTISADPAVEFVTETVEPALDQLPDAGTPLDRLRHHLAVRAGAAWNARAAVQTGRAPELFIADSFGGGMPNADNAVTLLNPAEFTNIKPSHHGYHVLGIAAGTFGGTGARGDVTGMYPGPEPLKLFAMDLVGRAVPFEGRLARLIKARVAAGVRVVVNTSLNNGRMKTNNDNRYSTSQAEKWARSIRGVEGMAARSAIEDSYIHAGSAGNINLRQPAREAFHNSVWNAAALPARFGPPLERFANTMVVENRRAIESTGKQYLPGCDLSPTSFAGGNLSAIGSWQSKLGVWSFLDSALTAGTNFEIAPGRVAEMEGTSMATPQVAGLAVYLWGIRPEWKSQAVVEIISANTHEVTAPCANAPVIDAYAAVLALDDTAGLDSADPLKLPVRTALLDVAGNDKKFDIADVTAYLDALFPPAPASDADYSRYDLNGDGFTGGARRARFNLDVDYDAGRRASKYSTVDLAPNKQALRRADGSLLDERSLTDFEILCYYVNSKLFSGTAAQLQAALQTKSTALGRPVSCNARVVTLKVNATSPSWSGLPATIRLSNFVARFPATSAGNSATCTNQGEPAGERGVPFFSAAVPGGVLIYAAIDVAGMPNPVSGGVVNRRNCSSFFAVSGSQVWINATGRAVFGFGGSVVSDWEYQVRYSNGSSTGAGKQCVVGNVPGSGFFAAAFSDPTCTHIDSVTITD